jgi:hypothetical protein
MWIFDDPMTGPTSPLISGLAHLAPSRLTQPVDVADVADDID